MDFLTLRPVLFPCTLPPPESSQKALATIWVRGDEDLTRAEVREIKDNLGTSGWDWEEEKEGWVKFAISQ